MIKKMPIRYRLTLMIVLLLTVCCVGLTFVLNFTAYKLADRINDSAILFPSTSILDDVGLSEITKIDENLISVPVMPTIPAVKLQQAKKGFSVDSVFYMLAIVIGGGFLTYYISGKALKPLDILNNQIKNLTVNNLCEKIDIPPTMDEIAELTESFNEMTDKLNNAFIMQKCFSANAAHELRTPLSVLKTKIDVFKKIKSHSTDEYDTLIHTFEKQTKRLSELVNCLLEMTNMSDEDDFTKEKICLDDVFEDIILELSGIANQNNITIALKCKNVNMHGNTDLIYRAFYNLIENAIKYNINGGTVTVTAKNEKLDTLIEISDTGIGIPDELKKSIFEPFYRVDKSRSRQMGGAGLGLSIVKNIITNHKGQITTKNNLPSGTSFIIKI